MPKPALPLGRIRRGAQVGRRLGAEAARSDASRAASYSRPEEERKAADERRRLEAAGRVVEVLGQMKGPPMKLGADGVADRLQQAPRGRAGRASGQARGAAR